MADVLDRDIAQEIEDTRGLVWGLEMSEETSHRRRSSVSASRW